MNRAALNEQLTILAARAKQDRETIERLAAELQAERDYSHRLKLALEMSDLLTEFPSIELPAVLLKLAPGPRRCVEHMIAAFPKYLSKEYFHAAVPPRDHVRDRELKAIDVWISHARKVLGYEAIETLWGTGWRMSPKFMSEVFGRDVSEVIPCPEQRGPRSRSEFYSSRRSASRLVASK